MTTVKHKISEGSIPSFSDLNYQQIKLALLKLIIMKNCQMLISILKQVVTKPLKKIIFFLLVSGCQSNSISEIIFMPDEVNSSIKEPHIEDFMTREDIMYYGYSGWGYLVSSKTFGTYRLIFWESKSENENQLRNKWRVEDITCEFTSLRDTDTVVKNLVSHYEPFQSIKSIDWQKKMYAYDEMYIVEIFINCDTTKKIATVYSDLSDLTKEFTIHAISQEKLQP